MESFDFINIKLYLVMYRSCTKQQNLSQVLVIRQHLLARTPISCWIKATLLATAAFTVGFCVEYLITRSCFTNSLSDFRLICLLLSSKRRHIKFFSISKVYILPHKELLNLTNFCQLKSHNSTKSNFVKSYIFGLFTNLLYLFKKS